MIYIFKSQNLLPLLQRYTLFGGLLIITLVWKMCDKIVTPPFHFDRLPTEVTKSLHRSQDSESEEKKLAHFLGGWAPTDLFISKKPTHFRFSVWVHFETWTLEYQSQFSFKLLVFSGHYMKRFFIHILRQPIQTSFVGKLPC